MSCLDLAEQIVDRLPLSLLFVDFFFIAALAFMIGIEFLDAISQSEFCDGS